MLKIDWIDTERFPFENFSNKAFFFLNHSATSAISSNSPGSSIWPPFSRLFKPDQMAHIDIIITSHTKIIFFSYMHAWMQHLICLSPPLFFSSYPPHFYSFHLFQRESPPSNLFLYRTFPSHSSHFFFFRILSFSTSLSLNTFTKYTHIMRFLYIHTSIYPSLSLNSPAFRMMREHYKKMDEWTQRRSRDIHKVSCFAFDSTNAFLEGYIHIYTHTCIFKIQCFPNACTQNALQKNYIANLHFTSVAAAELRVFSLPALFSIQFKFIKGTIFLPAPCHIIFQCTLLPFGGME